MAIFRDFLVFSPWVRSWKQTPFSPVSFGKSFMKIRSAVPENGCLIFCGGRKKNKKNKKKICKTYYIRIRLIGGCVNYFCLLKCKKSVPWNASFLLSKCTKMRLVAGLRPDPLGELTALLRPSWVKGERGKVSGRVGEGKWQGRPKAPPGTQNA